MNRIIEWASKHSVSQRALVELAQVLSGEAVTKHDAGMSENAVAQRIRLRASQVGMRLFRNNVGACESADGRQIRYGLANESKRINSECKSADLIGITPLLIKQHHIGTIVGVFTSIECKKSDWEYTGKGREVAQNNWKNIVQSLGGIAEFANNDVTIDEIKGRL